MLMYPDVNAIECSSWDDVADCWLSGPGDGIYYVVENGLACYVKLSGAEELKSSLYILVGFSGAVKNNGLSSGPFFSFSGVAKTLGIPLISFSDPSLMLSSKLKLGWYLGNKFIPDYPEKVAGFLNRILVFLNEKKLILSGGSGGGFAALNIAGKIKSSRTICFIWNPQIIIGNYYFSFVKDYVEVAWNISDLEVVKQKSIVFCGVKAVFLMDGLDHSHLRLHLRNYLLEDSYLNRCDNGYFKYNNSAVLLGDWGTGHTPPPKKIIIQQIKSIIDSWDCFEKYEKVLVSKEVVDFSSKKDLEAFSCDIAPRVSLVGDEFLIESNINSKYIGYQVRYMVLDKNNKILMKSAFLKNFHDCRVFGITPRGEVSNSLKVKTIIQDYFGETRVFIHPFRGRLKKYNYMEPC